MVEKVSISDTINSGVNGEKEEEAIGNVTHAFEKLAQLAVQGKL